MRRVHLAAPYFDRRELNAHGLCKYLAMWCDVKLTARCDVKLADAV